MSTLTMLELVCYYLVAKARCAGAVRWVPHYVIHPEYKRDRPMNSPTYLFYFEIHLGKLLLSLEVGFSLFKEGLGSLGGVLGLEDI